MTRGAVAWDEADVAKVAGMAVGRRIRPLLLLACCAAIACSGEPAAVAEQEPPPAKAAKPAPKPTPKPAPGDDPASKPVPAGPKTLPLPEAIAKATEIYADHRQSFYCGCSYTADLRTIRASCGYKTRANETRAHEIEWTQVVPPSAFGAQRPCWTTEACRRDDGSAFGGIECCRKSDASFARMEADLYNLVPVIGEIAEDRSDHAFAEIKGEERLYGMCDVEVDASRAVIEPPEKVRGDIARIYLYMRATYGDELRVPAEQWTLFERWAAEDPPDDWERQRSSRIAALQGQGDPQLAGGGEAKPPAEGKAPPPGKGAAPPSG
ncbi:MAG: endonuclease [Nannocystaceae bacterium]|nr:endonuclease [Nannocystaceae bacterium]